MSSGGCFMKGHPPEYIYIYKERIINKNPKLMRQIFTTMTALLALLATATGVRAETVDNYSYDFNTSINTSDHAFRVATGWGHIVDAFTYENPYSGTQTKY